MELISKSSNRLLTASELAERLYVALPSVYVLTRNGEFDEFLVRIGEKTYRYDPAGLESYIARGGRKEKTIEEQQCTKQH